MSALWTLHTPAGYAWGKRSTGGWLVLDYTNYYTATVTGRSAAANVADGEFEAIQISDPGQVTEPEVPVVMNRHRQCYRDGDGRWRQRACLSQYQRHHSGTPL